MTGLWLSAEPQRDGCPVEGCPRQEQQSLTRSGGSDEEKALLPGPFTVAGAGFEPATSEPATTGGRQELREQGRGVAFVTKARRSTSTTPAPFMTRRLARLKLDRSESSSVPIVFRAANRSTGSPAGSSRASTIEGPISRPLDRSRCSQSRYLVVVVRAGVVCRCQERPVRGQDERSRPLGGLPCPREHRELGRLDVGLTGPKSRSAAGRTLGDLEAALLYLEDHRPWMRVPARAERGLIG
jgi:hypothetical protein